MNFGLREENYVLIHNFKRNLKYLHTYMIN